MSDDSDLAPRLADVIGLLQRPVPIAAGLEQRARRRARRRRVRFAGVTGLLLVAGVAAIVLGRRTPGSDVTFALTAPAVRSVALVGDFTEWRSDRVHLQQAASGEWHATVHLPPGRYRFAYVVDRGEWRADSRAASAPDDFGRPTSVLTVVGN